jgi:hypothetical protein
MATQGTNPVIQIVDRKEQDIRAVITWLAGGLASILSSQPGSAEHDSDEKCKRHHERHVTGPLGGKHRLFVDN